MTYKNWIHVRLVTPKRLFAFSISTIPKLIRENWYQWHYFVDIIILRKNWEKQHTLADLSTDPVINVLPSDDSDMDITSPSWPWHSKSLLPVSRSHFTLKLINNTKKNWFLFFFFCRFAKICQVLLSSGHCMSIINLKNHSTTVSQRQPL